MVMHALVSEMQHRPWDVPPLPLPFPDLNVNPVKAFAVREIELMRASHPSHLAESGDYSGMAVLGIKGALMLVAWHTKEKWWGGARREIVILPKKVLASIVDSARSEIKRGRTGSRSGDGEELVSTGDVLVAWLLKVCFKSFWLILKLTNVHYTQGYILTRNFTGNNCELQQPCFIPTPPP